MNKISNTFSHLGNTFFNAGNIQSGRYSWVDFAKGVAIILVVYRHILIGIERADLEPEKILMDISRGIYSFRMPLFFVLSGIFVRRSIMKRTNGVFVADKFKTLMYPYLIWTFIQVTIQIFMSGYTNASRTIADYGYIFYQPRAIDHFWFIYALFSISLVFLLVFRLFKGNRYGLMLFAFAIYAVSPWIHINIFSDVCKYMIFFVIGDGIAALIDHEQYEKYKGSKYLNMIFLAVFASGQWLLLNYEDVNHLVFAVIALSGSLFTINLGFWLGNGRGWYVIRVVGYHSMYVYILHVMVSAASRIFLMKVMGIDSVPLLLTVGTILGIIVPIIFYNLTKHRLWFLFTLRRPIPSKPIVQTS